MRSHRLLFTFALLLSLGSESLRASAAPPTHAQSTRVGVKPATAAYTLVDVGNPGKIGFDAWYAPWGFNNTGQMVGVAYNYGGGQRCVAFNGTAFISITRVGDPFCYGGTSLSDMYAGSFLVVGAVNGETANGTTQAYVTQIKGTAISETSFAAFQGSGITAMNRHGVAVGYSAYQPPNNAFFSGSPPFVYTGTSTLTPMQPQCITSQRLCMANVSIAYCPPGCPTRLINSAGTVVGVDTVTGYQMEYTIGKPSSGVDLPALNGTAGASFKQVTGIDDAANVYLWGHPAAGGSDLAYKYALATGKLTSVPPALGNCNYHPLSVNGSGSVLGIATCGSNTTGDYFVWNSTTGTVTGLGINLGNPACLPSEINDTGAILVAIPTTNPGPDWGELVPSSAAARTGGR